ncbi:hypothetical protein [Comamonas thiooxydans]|uniref:Uncharacterized protein n=1 Tax=Comamonas thiooxydans TaxID=363952 RepID=A0A0E3BUT0_9BURK|nr:hypothetical protein [Comamonas thiooxydans]KGH05240.1 hypothetical protein P608_23425 [Comamonas thiooxydans]KGH10318.1 hypothetical protein P607_26530 [Comamonas thiooxydans]KGH18561.1 hypothetical protein P606_24855 [Comamonas thiooxydans]
MGKSTYRALVIASLGIPLFGMLAEYGFDLVPHELTDLSQSLLMQSEVGPTDWIFLLALSVLVVLGLIAFYGLLRFRAWAPRFTLWSSAATVVVACFSPPIVLSGLGNATSALGFALFGAVLALPYYAPEVREMFWPSKSED